MSTELGVSIKIDAPSALPTIAGVESALGKVEAAGPRVGDALSRGLGAGAPAADKSTKSAQDLAVAMQKLANSGQAFAGLTDQLKREADMLEKIHGPAKQYQADLQALDGLLMRGAVTTDEYAQQVTKMNEAIDGAPEKVEKAENATTKLGEAFEALKMPAVGAGVLELGHKVAELAEQADRLQDTFTEVSNKTLKFADATHSANQILDEQQALSVKLNSTLDPTIELYDRVRIGSDNLRISHEEQIRMTQTLGESVQEANKPLEAAGEIMQRFAFAMESGVTDVRSVKQVMLEVPEAAKVWQESFHMTDQQILTAVRNGKLGARELAMAWAQNGEAVKKVDDDFAKRQKTNEQAVKEFGEAVNTYTQRGDLSGFQAMNASMLGKNSMYAKVATDGFGGLSGDKEDAADIERGRAAIAALNDDIKNGTGAWRSMGDAAETALQKTLENIALLPDKLMQTVQGAENLASAFGLMADKWATVAVGPNLAMLRYQLDMAKATTDEQKAQASDALDAATTAAEASAKQIKITMEHSAAIGQAKQQMAALKVVIKEGGIAGDDARKQYEALATTINDGRLPATIKMFDAIHEPVRTFTEDVDALNGMLKEGVISWDQYDQQMQKTIASSVDPMIQLLNKFDSPMEQQTRGIALLEQAWASGRVSLEHYNDELARLYALTGEVQANSVTGGKLDPNQGLALPKIGGGDYAMPQVDFSSVPSPQSYAHGLGTKAYEANQNYYSKAEKEQYDEFEKRATDAISGIDNGLKKLRDDTLDISKTIATDIGGVFNALNENIVAMVTTGTADWSKFATLIETDLAKIALQTLEKSAVEGLTSHAVNAVGGSATGVTTGASAAATMLAAAPGIGLAIGSAAAAAIAVGAAGAGAAQGATASAALAIGSGLWTGGDAWIPRAANGFAGRIAGVAGTDTRLAQILVSPGEHISVRTPQQEADQQRAGGQVVNKIINQHDTRGELADGLSSGAFDTHVINIMKRNAGAVQALIRK